MEALKLEPVAPDLKFNLANAYMLRDRESARFPFTSTLSPIWSGYRASYRGFPSSFILVPIIP